ncbi:MAG: hypothetical protein K0B05_05385 [Bacteroidales bacterium]|nr:hypothetical protein [Bacteroidales bacterium]
MEKKEIGLILENQREYFLSGKTLEISRRLETLKKLRRVIPDYTPYNRLKEGIIKLVMR